MNGQQLSEHGQTQTEKKPTKNGNKLEYATIIRKFARLGKDGWTLDRHELRRVNDSQLRLKKRNDCEGGGG